MLTKNAYHDIANTKRFSLINGESGTLFVDKDCSLTRDTYAFFDATAIFRLRTRVMCFSHLFFLLASYKRVSCQKSNIPGMLLLRRYRIAAVEVATGADRTDPRRFVSLLRVPELTLPQSEHHRQIIQHNDP